MSSTPFLSGTFSDKLTSSSYRRTLALRSPRAQIFCCLHTIYQANGWQVCASDFITFLEAQKDNLRRINTSLHGFTSLNSDRCFHRHLLQFCAISLWFVLNRVYWLLNIYIDWRKTNVRLWSSLKDHNTHDLGKDIISVSGRPRKANW
jgi:hypothetical protein